MPKPSPLAADRFTFKLYKRTLPKGEMYYARFFVKGQTLVLADRSTGEAEEDQALVAAGKMLAQLPLEKLARAKAAMHQDGFEAAERLRNMDRIADALEVPVYELFMKDSPAVERAVSKFEVRERLEQKVLKAINEALDEEGRAD